MAPDSSQPNSFKQQFAEAQEGITAAANIEPYDSELLRAAYLGASALIDENQLKPMEQMTHRKKIAQLAGTLATKHEDETTAAEMKARVKDCDQILKLIKPTKAAKPKRATTSASKTSGAKGQ